MHTTQAQAQAQQHRHPQSSFASGNVLSEEQRFNVTWLAYLKPSSVV